MSVTTEPAQDILERTRQAVHPRGIVGGRADEHGLGLRFSLREDGSVEACFECDEPAVMRASISRSQARLHIVEAQIVQDGQVKAKAIGKFMERPLS
jgi:hypothetical protein